MLKNIKKYFITGILVLFPLLITIFILINVFNFTDRILGKYINTYLKNILGFYIPGLGIILCIIILFFVGFLTTHFIGRRLYLLLDKALRRFPLIRLIYPSAKQIIEFLFAQKSYAFKKVVLVEYPRKGIWSIGFTTNEGFQEAKEKSNHDLLNVFIPSSPGPLTGFLVLIPRQEVVFLDIATEDAIRLLVSGGVLNPISPIEKD